MNTIIELDGIEMFISTLQSIESLNDEEITAINSFINNLDKDNSSKVKSEIKKYRVSELLANKKPGTPKAPSISIYISNLYKIESSGTSLPDPKKASPKKSTSAASSPTKVEDTENVFNYKYYIYLDCCLLFKCN